MRKRTLYARRNLLNAKDLQNWAFKQGFPTALNASDMHVTIAYSKDRLDWDEIPKDVKPFSVINWNDFRKVPEKGALISIPDKSKRRMIRPLGNEGAIVLKFPCDYLKDRWKEFIYHGASWDYASYQPHVTITYNGKGFDPRKIKPYLGPLHFGPEIYEELDGKWNSRIKEKQNPNTRK